MAYVKQNWANKPSNSTPITEAALDHLETQYDEAMAEIPAVVEEVMLQTPAIIEAVDARADAAVDAALVAAGEINDAVMAAAATSGGEFETVLSTTIGTAVELGFEAVPATINAAFATRLVVSDTEPLSPVAGMVWLDTSYSEPGVVARFDSSLLAGVADGEVITEWSDVVGAFDLTGTATYRASSALFGGHPVVAFDGAAQKLTNTALILSETTDIIVARLTSVTGSSQVLLGSATSTGGTRRMIWKLNAATVWQAVVSASSLTSALTVDTAPHVHGTSFAPNNAIYRTDATTVSRTDIAVPNTRGGLRLGNSDSNSAATALEVAEVIIYDRVLTEIELTTKMDELRTKWGLV